MKPFLIVLGSLALFWLLFSFIPTLITFICVFGRTSYRSYSKEQLESCYYAKYAELISSSRDILRSLPQERIACTGSDGIKLSGRVFGEKGFKNKTAVLIHGYRADPECALGAQLLYFLDRGWTVLLTDQRGNGESGGRFTSMGINESGDLIKWTGMLRDSGCPEIAVYGISMGATTTAFASDRLDADKLILDCPFLSPSGQLVRLCKKLHLPPLLLVPTAVLIGRILIKADLRKSVMPHLQKCNIPAFFLCGDADSTVSYTDVVAASRECKSSRGSFTAAGTEHACAFFEGGDRLKEELDRFLGDSESIS